ncbi:hypothetical protein OG618_02715 [Kitasatospora sp. NBC_01246]|uniref:hypothetical protein n=1 Tax=Kitasatospora sp. NBC_01246 TaxID=2903570 RepID=UPI002E3057A1|nr:hypothetical protein [Kitasatospora sp. NBC_01246]
MPLRPGATLPDWLPPASRDGWTLLFGARWTPLLPVLEDHPIRYVSSANRTGHPPAASAADATAMFPDTVPVLGATSLTGAGRDPAGPPRWATTTLRLHAGGRIYLRRHGAEDHPHGSADRYLERVRAGYGGTAAPNGRP